MYTLDSPFSEIAEIIVRLDSCIDLSEFDNGITTMRDVIPHLTQAHALWAVKVVGRELDPELRMALLRKITNDRLAFDAYVQIPTLTSEEDAYLLSIFRGKLENCERDLAFGVVTRAKYAS
jgi:hypothetical protein